MPFGHTLPNGGKPVYPTWTKTLNNRGCGTWPNEENAPTRYEQFMYAMINDDRFQREVTLGKRIGLYKFRNDLGSGNFSRVKLAFHQLAHERVAIKIIDKTGMDQRALKMLSREMSTMDTLRHPAIVRLYEVMETISKVYLVMEIAPMGEIYTRITNEGKYDEKTSQNLFSQVLSAVEFMHDHDLYHRDIKAENVFLVTANEIRLGDFGFSTQQIRDQDNRDAMLTTFCGSPPYAAPELFNDDSYNGGPVDVWALGVLLFFMTTAVMPYQAQTLAGLKNAIIENDYYVPEYLSEPCKNLVAAILQSKPQERLTIQQIKNHPWMHGQQYPLAIDDRHFVPKLHKNQKKSDLESRVVVRLSEIGISESMLMEHSQKGARSAVIGTYRILMHRMNTESTRLRCVAQVSSAAPDGQQVANNASQTAQVPQTKTDRTHPAAAAAAAEEEKTPVEDPCSAKDSGAATSPQRRKFRSKFHLAVGGFVTKKRSIKYKNCSSTCSIL